MTIKQCGVYQITNTITGDFYIGSSANVARRMQEHRRELSKNEHINPYLQRAWNKYGENAFEFTTILLCVPENQLYYEQACIDILKPIYNIAKSAEAPMFGREHSEETKQKISDGNRGKVVSDETRAKMSESGTGRIVLEKTRKKISEANSGKHHTEETKQKMSETRNGHIVSEKTRKKISESLSGENHPLFSKHHSDETRAKMSEVKRGNKNYGWIDIPDEKMNEMKTLRAHGYPYYKIAEIFGISKDTVWRRLHNYIND